MRTWTKLVVAVLIAVLGLQTESIAQWREGAQRGLFGEREFGKPLKPRTSRMFGGLERGPSGSFIGRSTPDWGTTFEGRAGTQPAAPSAVPPGAYDLEPDMVPGYLEDQARRMAAAREQILQQADQLRQLQQRQQLNGQQAQSTPPPAMPERPNGYQPPVMPERPDRYRIPPGFPQPSFPRPSSPVPNPSQPSFPRPQPAVPGSPAPSLKNSPDRWFRGAPSPAGPGQQMPLANPPASPQRYTPGLGLGPVGRLGPSGVAGQAAMSRSSAATLGSRISQALGAGVRTPISATVQGDTVTLQGTVTTANDRHLAERLAAMEPGVRRIDNRINVETAPAGP